MASANDEGKVGPVLRGLADRVKVAVGDDAGFALFVSPLPGVWTYISTCERDDVVQALETWLERTDETGFLSRTKGPSGIGTGDVSPRQSLEARCAEIGKVIASRGMPTGLFLFEFGGSNVAYIASIPDFRIVIERWVAKQKGRN